MASIIETIKHEVLISIYSTEALMNRLILKGGNAINLAFKLYDRQSMDLDFSIENDFDNGEIQSISNCLEKEINTRLLKHGLHAFDFKSSQKPKIISPNRNPQWKGYKIEFKVLRDEFLQHHLDAKRRNAIMIGDSSLFSIEISPFEYIGDTLKISIGNDVLVNSYSPALTLMEKLRALCQQTDEYCKIQNCKKTPRSRDFYDIYILSNKIPESLSKDTIVSHLQSVFDAKQVPLKLLYMISDDYDFHALDFKSVSETVKEKTEDFEFYFRSFNSILRKLESFGIIQPPSS